MIKIMKRTIINGNLIVSYLKTVLDNSSFLFFKTVVDIMSACQLFLDALYI